MGVLGKFLVKKVALISPLRKHARRTTFSPMSDIEEVWEPTRPDPAVEIRGRLFAARGRYTKEEFAVRMGGIDPDTICNYESGKTTRLNIRTLRDWAWASDVPGVTLEWLIGDWTVPKGGAPHGPMSADPLVLVHPSDLVH